MDSENEKPGHILKLQYSLQIRCFKFCLSTVWKRIKPQCMLIMIHTTKIINSNWDSTNLLWKLNSNKPRCRHLQLDRALLPPKLNLMTQPVCGAHLCCLRLTSNPYVCLSQGLLAPCVRSTLMSVPALPAKMEPSALTVPMGTNAAALKVSC